MVKVAIFDYGAGNIFSLKNSLEKADAQVDVITSFDKSSDYSGILLPGVGNFDPAIKSIRDYSKTQFKDYVQNKIPVLGICLGMEMFFEKSEEGNEKGLGVIDGEVVILPNSMKVPHMGWNQANIQQRAPIFEGIDDLTHFYFVHSYFVVPSDPKVVAIETQYHQPFCAAIWRDNLFATQFHPEKSQANGLRILKNFAEL